MTDERMFFGRDDVFAWIEQNIGGRFSENMLVLHGQRRVGKTSVLKQLEKRLPDQYVPVFFDFQGRTHTTINRFLYRLAREIHRKLKREHDITISVPDRDAFEEDAEYFAGQFLTEVKQALEDRNLVLVFDEFDTLEERTAREMLGQYLIPYFSRMVHGAERLNFIFSIGSSGHRLEHMRSEYTDFFRVSLYKRISFLDKEDARQLIVRPVQGMMTYSDPAVDRILEITSGHPYFIQLLCHELFAKAQRTGDWQIDREDVRKILPDVIERGTVNLKFVWDVASSTERYTLSALANLGPGAAKEDILALLKKHNVRISGEEIGEALLELTARDVLSKKHTFRVELLRLWLLENRPLKRVVDELAEKHPVAVRYTQIAEEFRDNDQIEDALENYENAIDAAPQYLPAWLGKAAIFRESGRWLDALDTFQTALELEPGNKQARAGLSEVHVELGDTAKQAGDREKAVARYQQALEVNPEHREARERLAALNLSRAKTLAQQKKWPAAGEFLLKAWKYIPESVDALQTAPQEIAALQSSEQLEQALAPIEQSLSALRARIARDFLEEAVQLREGEKYSAALVHLKRALSYDPENEAVQREMRITRQAERESGAENIYRAGQRAFRAQRWGEAISTLQRFLALEPDSTKKISQTKAWIKEARTQEELAERYAAARQAVERGAARRAVSLLREISDLADDYRDTEQLLEQARLKWWGSLFRQAAAWCAGVFLIAAIGWWLLRPSGPMQAAAVRLGLYENTPTSSPLSTPEMVAEIPAEESPTPTPAPLPTRTPVPLAWSRLSPGQLFLRDIVTAIAVDPEDPGVLYVGTENAGIYKSINGGVSWQPIQKGLGSASIRTIAIDPQDPSTVYAGVVNNGVYKTTDGGQSWQAANNGMADYGTRNSIVIVDPTDSQHLFYTSGRGVYESFDGAASWSFTKPSGCFLEIVDLALDPTDGISLFATNYAVDPDIDELGVEQCEGGVYKSQDGGATWTRISPIVDDGFWDESLTIDSQTGDYLHAIGMDQWIYSSTDGGESWIISRDKKYWEDAAIDPQDSSVAYILWNENVYKTANGGQTWEEISYHEFNTTDNWGKIHVSPHEQETLMVGSRGFFVSNDSGKSWIEHSAGLGSTRLDLSIDPEIYSTLYVQIGGGLIFRSQDGGSNWEKYVVGEALGSEINAYDSVRHILYEFHDWHEWEDGELDQAAVLRFVDDGDGFLDLQEKDPINVFPLPYGTQKLNTVRAHPYQDGFLYMIYDQEYADDAYIYISKDNGNTWQDTEGLVDMYNTRLFFDHDQGEVIYAVEENQRYRSDDAGETWQLCADHYVGSPNVRSPISDTRMAVHPQDSDWLVLATKGNGILISEDGCKTWVHHNNGLGNFSVNTVAIDPQNPDVIYAGTDNGAYVSFNRGEEWAPINDGLLGGLVIYSISIDDQSNVYAATPLGIFQLEDQ